MKDILIIIIDSHLELADPPIPNFLKDRLNLSEESFLVLPVEKAFTIFKGKEKPVMAKNLLIFVSTFYGNKIETIRFSRMVKDENTNAKVIARSELSIKDRIFDGYIEKNRSKDREFLNTIALFIHKSKTQA